MKTKDIIKVFAFSLFVGVLLFSMVIASTNFVELFDSKRYQSSVQFEKMLKEAEKETFIIIINGKEYEVKVSRDATEK